MLKIQIKQIKIFEEGIINKIDFRAHSGKKKALWNVKKIICSHYSFKRLKDMNIVIIFS